MHTRSTQWIVLACTTVVLAACSDATAPDSKRPMQDPITVAGTDPRLATRTEECPNRCMIVIDYSAVPITAGTPPMGRSSPGQAGGIASINENAVVLSEGGVVWSKTGTRTLLPQAGHVWVYGSDINDYGQVAGASVSNNVDIIWHATVWEPSGQALDVGTFGGPQSRANALNDLPQVVGWAERADYQPHAFIWTWNDGIKPLSGMPAGVTRSDARDINDQGEVVGYYGIDSKETAFIWSAETGVRALPEPEGTVRAMANSINGAGWVAGTVTTAAGPRAALWKPTSSGSYEFIDLGTLPEDVRATAVGVNHWGEVIGTSSLEFGSPTRDIGFVSFAGEMVGLTTNVSVTRAINSWGDIAGRGDAGTGTRPVIWAWPENVHRYE